MARLHNISKKGCRDLLLCFLAAATAHAQPILLTPNAGTGSTPAVHAARGEAVDVQEADAFIWQVFYSLDVAQYDTAAQTYLSMLAQLDGPLSAAEQAILIRHLRQTAIIMPKPERDRIGLDQVLVQGALDGRTGGTGAQLVRWWRRQDTLPATGENERLEEHLTRVVFATIQYPSEDDVRRFDDRGEVYVRLGAPSGNISIELEQNIAAFDFRNAVSIPEIPENEFWVYGQVSDAAHYLFIREGRKRPYRLGDALELIPPELRAGQRKTQILLQVMEEVYAQLALQHPFYGTIFDEIAAYRGLPPPSAVHPNLFALHMMAQAQAEDTQAEARREEVVPTSYSDTYGLTEVLAVPVRWARFLDPDGTTRTEVYWSLNAPAMRPSRRLVRRLRRQGYQASEKYLLSMSVAQQTPDYLNRALSSRHYLIPTDVQGALPVKSFAARGDTGTYHLALQWDQAWIRTEGELNAPDVRLKIGTLRIDSLQALDSREDRLEMSDLKPLSRVPLDALAANTPYPYTGLTPETSLALYLELYHLTFGAEDRTHYALEYEITRSEKKGGLLRFLGSGKEERTAVRTSYTGSSRMAREHIELDLSEWRGKGEMQITVRATDETTGAQVARSLTFTLEQ